MTQCELSCGTSRTVAWIDDKFAKVGKSVTRENDNRTWIVSEVYGRMEDKTVKSRERDYTRHRSTTDI